MHHRDLGDIIGLVGGVFGPERFKLRELRCEGFGGAGTAAHFGSNLFHERVEVGGGRAFGRGGGGVLGKRGGKWRGEPGQQSEEEAVDFHDE